MPDDVLAVDADPLAALRGFRREVRACMTRRGDALFELTDAMLCAQGPVASPVELSMEPEFCRGHGSVYAALARGCVEQSVLCRLLAGLVAPPRPGEPLMFAVDTTSLARPDAVYADQLTMVQVRGKGGDVFLPGWSYSVLVGVGWGASSWVDPVGAVRLAPGDDHTRVTVGQVRQLAADLVATGAQRADMLAPLVMFDAGYDATAIGYELGDAGVQTLTRLSSRRVFYCQPPPRPAGKRGAPARHGARLSLSDAGDRPPADHELSAVSERYGKVRVQAWHNMHQQLGRSGHWADWPAGKPLPIVAGTVLRISVERLPAGRKPQRDIWLFHTALPGAVLDLDLLWKAYLRRFDQEHFHRFVKVYLGLDAAHLVSAQATDRWVLLALAAYAQLRIASRLPEQLRRPWHPQPAPGTVPSPYRTRLGFRRLRARLGSPAQPAKFTRPGPGRPRGSKNRPKAPQPPHRRTVKTDINQPQRR